MRFLARREHSREELHRKLVQLAAEGENVDAVLDDLAMRGWLSDARYAEQAVRAKARRFGPLKVAHQLRSKGVEDETIAAAFRAAGDEGAAHIDAVWRSRFSTPPGNERERGRQVRFLQGRGFPLEEILRFLRGSREENRSEKGPSR
jgi:regulatory protein